MQKVLKPKHTVSWHIRDLLKLDVYSLDDVCNWLETNAVKQRDIDRRAVSKRLGARMIAAQIMMKAMRDGDIAAAREVMDRTEGKVADKLITVDYNELVKQLEAARQRVLAHQQQSLPVTEDQRKQGVLEEQDIDRLHISSYQTLKTLTPEAGDRLPVSVSEQLAEDALPVPVPTNTAGSHQGVSSNKLPHGHTSGESGVAEDSDVERDGEDYLKSGSGQGS